MAGVNHLLKKPQQSTRLGSVKSVCKRDGFIEPFSIEKLEGWAEWACARHANTDWNLVIRNALRYVAKEQIHTDELQELLIKSAIALVNTQPEYDLVARDLYLARLRKQVYDSFDPPSLRGWHDILVRLGTWQDMSIYLTEEDWERLENAIDHERDFRFSYAGIKQFADKYLRRNDMTDELYETPQFTYMGMAMSMLEAEDWTVDEVIELYDAMSLHKLNIPTPLLVGLRSTDRGFASCCLMEAGDSLDSIDAAEHIIFKMVAARAGIGYLPRTRSVGDPIRGGAFMSTGKLPYIRHALASTQSNTQQSRGGSMTANVPYFDPEIMDIISAKSQRSAAEKRLDKSDFAIQINRMLLKRALKGESITLMSLYDAPELYNEFVNPNGTPESFEEVYTAAEKRLKDKKRQGKGGKLVPLCQTLPAIDILEHIVTVRMETGRLYIQLMDNTNSHSNFDEPIKMTNLCVSGDTNILTDKGEVTIFSRVGKPTTIWNGEEWSEGVVPVKTGENQSLLEITFSDGSTLKATPYHKFYHSPVGRRGAKSVKSKLEEVRAVDLVPGYHRMPKFVLPVINGSKVLPHPYTNGFFTGDGTYGKNRNGSLYPKLYFYGDKQILVDKIDSVIVGSGIVDSSDRLSYIVRSPLQDKFFVPTAEYTIDSRIKWLEGLLDADGCIQLNKTTPSIVLSSIDKSFLQEVRVLLRSLGVHSKFSTTKEATSRVFKEGQKSYDCSAVHRIIIGSSAVFKLVDLGIDLANLDLDTVHRPNRDASQFVTVVSIEEGPTEDTYCFTEPKLNLGVFNGILAGNCVEINQPTYAFNHVVDLYKTPAELHNAEPGDIGEVSLCNLGAFTLGNFDDSEWERLAYLLLKMIDTVIEIQDYAFPTMEFTAKARRNVGIGLMNVAGAMAKDGLQFVGVEARNWIHRKMENHAYWLHKASVRLAKERGAATWAKHALPMKHGRLVIDTYNKSVDELVTEPLHLDWEGLRAEIGKYGMRNSVLSAQMPGESSSVVQGVTNSINPIREIVTYKRSGVNIVPQVAYGVTDGQGLEDIYTFAFDLDMEEWIKFVAVIQKFMNQSISADLWYRYTDYENERIPNSVVIRHIMLAMKYGWKSMYYAWFDVDNGGSVHTQAQGCDSGACSI